MSKDNQNINTQAEGVKAISHAASLAEKLLEPIREGAPWLTSNLFILAGRRPLRLYPNVFLAPTELRAVITLYEESGIPEKRLKEAFTLCASKLATYKISGRRIETVDVFSWLIGWIRDQLLETAIKETRLQNAVSKQPLKGSYRSR